MAEGRIKGAVRHVRASFQGGASHAGCRRCSALSGPANQYVDPEPRRYPAVLQLASAPHIAPHLRAQLLLCISRLRHPLFLVSIAAVPLFSTIHSSPLHR